jgi:hypothetical protein
MSSPIDNESVPSHIPQESNIPGPSEGGPPKWVSDLVAGSQGVRCPPRKKYSCVPTVSVGDAILDRHEQIQVVERDNSIESAQQTLDRHINVTYGDHAQATRRVQAKKTLVCRQWQANGSCSFGTNCKFHLSHVGGVVEPPVVDMLDRAATDFVEPVKIPVAKKLTPEQIKYAELFATPCNPIAVNLVNNVRTFDPYWTLRILRQIAFGTFVITATALFVIELKVRVGMHTPVGFVFGLWFALVCSTCILAAQLIYMLFRPSYGSINEYNQTDTSSGFVATVALENPYQLRGYSPMAMLGGKSLEPVTADLVMLDYLRLKEGMVRPTKFTITRFAQELQQHFRLTRSQKIIGDTARVYHQEQLYLQQQANATSLVAGSLERL